MSAQSVSVSVYVTNTRLLTIPAVNVPGEGSYQTQLMLEGEDPALRVGRILTVAQLQSADKAFKLPVAYLFNEPLIAIPALAVKTPDGRVSYFDITLRKYSLVEPLKFVVATMVETTGGQSAAKGETGPQGPAGTPGAPGGPPGPAGPAGSPGSAGVTGPAGSTGPAGAAGTAGTAGVDGKTVLNGAVDPVPGVGTNGDFYFNTATTTIFGPKAAGAWPAGVLLKGAAGAAGAAGPAGSIGATGPAGAAGSAGTAGSAGVAGAVGPAGPTGAAGAAGATGPAGSGGSATGSSAHVVALTTVAGGLVGTVGVLPLYGYNQTALPLVGLAGVAALSVLDEPFSMAQPFKSGATLTKIQAVIGLKVGLALVGSTNTVTATLYKIPLSGSPVSTGLSCDLGPAFTGTVALGTKASCTGSGSVSVNAGDRGLIVFSATASGLSLISALTISAAASVE